MSDAKVNHCSRCGARSTGKFCTSCGAPLALHSCASCGQPLAAGNAFCVQCGTAAGAAAPTAVARGGQVVTPWRVVAVLAVVAAVAVVWALTSPRGTAGSGATAAPDGAQAVSAPDISNLTPREQFGRLADKIETAMAAGDTATVVRFFPMAEAAFANLTDSTRDNDARFHMSLLRVRVGHFPAAMAEVDSIAAGAPKHLFVSYLRAIIGDLKNDSASATAARRAFREHFAGEMALNRPEYQMHREMLDQFLATIPAGGSPR